MAKLRETHTHLVEYRMIVHWTDKNGEGRHTSIHRDTKQEVLDYLHDEIIPKAKKWDASITEYKVTESLIYKRKGEN